jgi:hypothetical protein
VGPGDASGFRHKGGVACSAGTQPAFTTMPGMTSSRAGAIVIMLTAALAGCGGDDSTTASTTASTTPVVDPGDGGSYDPPIDPANFVDRIDNPYLPLLPGATWSYEAATDEGTERIEVSVTPDRRTVMGISAVVVRDTVALEGEVIEDTFDWFAQDGDGNVWYLGEETTEYENGEPVSTEGSWEAGVDGALPGIVMLAEPAVGEAYRQEYYPGEAEDLAEVVRVGESETVPFGSFDGLVVIEEWNPLEPDVVEEKFYAPGVGTVLEVAVVGGDERVELVSYTPGT